MRADSPSSSISVAMVLRKLCVFTPDAPSSSRASRHCRLEIARVAQRARGRREDDCLLAEVRQPPTRPQHVDGEARQRYRSPAGQIDARYYWLPTGEQTPRDGSYRMAQASGAVRQIGVSSQQHAARY
jgi:hypothetical protein